MSAREPSSEGIQLAVDESCAGLRLDSFLVRQFPTYSRVRLRRVIDTAGVQVDGRRVKAAYHVHAGERVSITFPDLPREGPEPERMPLDIVYEDECLIVVNKPPGMVVHPARGHWSGTLASGLAYHCEQLSSLGGPTRPGIVHRLDRDTSGVIVVAKNDASHANLARQFEKREVEKQYFAIVAGVPDRDRDSIEEPIGRHPKARQKMAIRRVAVSSRWAVSFYEVIERFDGFAAVSVLPRTGRTHQIRVHLYSIGCPVLCDRQYGGRRRITAGEIRRNDDAQVLLDRQALHARRIGFTHPGTRRAVSFEAPLPDDLKGVMAELRRYRAL